MTNQLPPTVSGRFFLVTFVKKPGMTIPYDLYIHYNLYKKLVFLQTQIVPMTINNVII